ncbi:hypothetical protein SBADM41S_05091 [Streptomyces badius]
MTRTVPQPRSSPDAAPACADAALARRYARELGWATEGRDPLRLLTGESFDVLELPAEAGHAVLRRGVRTGPVLLSGTRMGLLVAAGGADELPGLLDWLEWSPLTPDLTAVGAGGRVTAPPLPGSPGDSTGAAVWLRPPEPRRAPGWRCRPSQASGAVVGMLPISYAWWTRRPRNAIGSGCHTPVPACRQGC